MRPSNPKKEKQMAQQKVKPTKGKKNEYFWEFSKLFPKRVSCRISTIFVLVRYNVNRKELHYLFSFG